MSGFKEIYMSKLITATVLAALLVTPVANAGDLDKLLGAAAGAAVGSTIGKGDGRTIAMAAGAIIGANLADSNRSDYNYNSYNYNNYSYSDLERMYTKHCRREVPARYSRNRGTRDAWVQGCVNRMMQEQQELENEAYQEGSSGESRHHRYHHE
jgi:hypothetical protein